jgi:hypothetical protein
MSSVKRVMRLASLGLLLAASAVAQPRTDFSGRWQLAPDPNATATGTRSVPPLGTGWPPDISIAQDATSLTIEYATYGRGDMQPPTRLVYRLDGSESKNAINVGRGPQEQSSTAAWDGAKLTLTIVRSFTAARGEKPATVRSTHTLSLESPATLVVETTHGAALGGKSSTSRSIYKKI